MQAYRSILILLLSCTSVLAVTNPVPLVNQPLVPASTLPGGKGFTLTVNGTGFVSGAVVNWNRSGRSTTFVSQSQLTAQISAADVAKPQSAAVSVINPAPGGGRSNVVSFEVALPAPAMAMVTQQFNQKSPIFVGVAADFNGDGKLDIAGSNSYGSEVFVSLGRGDGTFKPPVPTSLNSMVAYGMVAADFNGDGKLDLAYVTTNSAISVLLGNGDGTFRHEQDYSTLDSEPQLGVADFNGDGKLDLAVTNPRENELSVYLGNGDGTFQKPIITATGGESPVQFAVGDFNGDGKLDLAILEINSFEVTIMLGNGDGTFVVNNEYFLDDWPSQIFAADVNGDGKLDLVCFATRYVQEFLGNGDGTFQNSKTIWKLTTRELFDFMAVSDMNADGKLDLVGLAGLKDGNNLVLFKGIGNGTFQSPLLYPVSADLGSAPFVLGDFNNDGKTDMVTDFRSQGAADVSLLQSPGVLMPGLLNFGTALIGGKNPPKTITLTNTGVSALPISGISIMGQNAGDFSQTNSCPASLPSLSSCKIHVTFSPTQDGQPETAAVQISDKGGPESVPLSGEGTVIQVSPLKLDFGDVRVGFQSKPQLVTLLNTSNSDVQVNRIYIKGPTNASFFETNNCGSDLPAGAKCTIRVTFSPFSNGRMKAQAVAEFDYGGPPSAIVELGGTGIK